MNRKRFAFATAWGLLGLTLVLVWLSAGAADAGGGDAAPFAQKSVAGQGAIRAVAGYNGQPGYELITQTALLFLPIAARSDVNTTLFIQNTGTAMAYCAVYFFLPDGYPIHTTLDTIPAHGSLTYNLATMPELPPGFEGSIVVEATEPAWAIANVQRSGTDSLLSYNGVLAGAGEVVLPDIRRNHDGWTTDFWVQSAGPEAAAVTMSYQPVEIGNTFVASDTIPSGASHRYNQADMAALGDHFSGFVTITADQPVVVVVEAWDSASPKAFAYNGLALDDLGSAFLSPRQQKDLAGWSSNTAILNITGAEATVTAWFFTGEGSAILTDTTTVPSGGRAFYNLPDLPAIPAGFDGSLAATADQPLAALVHWLNAGATGDAIATNPAIGGDQVQGKGPLAGPYDRHLPRVARLGAEGVSTEFSIQNVAQTAMTATATISFYHESGVATVVVTDLIPYHGVARYTTRNMMPLGLNWEGSATIHTDCPVAVEAVQIVGEPYTETVEANFTAHPTAGPAPLQVVFVNNSSGDYTTSLWTFGDGMTSTLENPIHTYTTAGAYTVTLTVSGPGGTDTLTRSHYINVYTPVEAGFVAWPTEGLAPLTVTFTNTSTGDFTASLWTFGDGVTSTLENPIHTYTAAGAYTVTLTVSGPGGTDTLTRSHYINVCTPVEAGFVAWPTEGLAPLTVTFTNTSTGDFTASLWDLGDGVTSTLGNPSHVYTAIGVYTVSLTVSGPGGSDTETQAEYISVGQLHTVYLPLILRQWP